MTDNIFAGVHCVSSKRSGAKIIGVEQQEGGLSTDALLMCVFLSPVRHVEGKFAVLPGRAVLTHFSFACHSC